MYRSRRPHRLDSTVDPRSSAGGASGSEEGAGVRGISGVPGVKGGSVTGGLPEQGNDVDPVKRRAAPAAPSATLRTETITDLDQLDALRDAWRTLLAESPGATAFASPEWILTWYRHFGSRRGVYAITVRRDDRLVGLLPFAISRFGGRKRAGFALLVSAGTEHGDYGEALLGADPEPVAAAVADHLCQLVRDQHVAINLRRLCDDGPLLRALEDHDDVGRHPMGQVAQNALVDFTVLDDPVAHLERLARKRDIPRSQRRLAEVCGDVTFEPTTDGPDATDTALDTMRDMLARRWADGGGPRTFATPALEAFTRDVVRELVAGGLGRVSTVRAGGRPVSVSIDFRLGQRYVGHNSAFDPDLSSFGPGQAHLYEVLRCAQSEGAVEFDLRAGDYPYKRKWANAERVTRSLVLVAPGRAGEIALRARRVAMSVRARRIRRREQADPRSHGSHGPHGEQSEHVERSERSEPTERSLPLGSA
jgi:CelD/BcsL family acetyltransferase involved in cellulose biosynthesis